MAAARPSTSSHAKPRSPSPPNPTRLEEPFNILAEKALHEGNPGVKKRANAILRAREKHLEQIRKRDNRLIVHGSSEKHARIEDAGEYMNYAEQLVVFNNNLEDQGSDGGLIIRPLKVKDKEVLPITKRDSIFKDPATARGMVEAAILPKDMQTQSALSEEILIDHLATSNLTALSCGRELTYRLYRKGIELEKVQAAYRQLEVEAERKVSEIAQLRVELTTVQSQAAENEAAVAKEKEIFAKYMSDVSGKVKKWEDSLARLRSERNACRAALEENNIPLPEGLAPKPIPPPTGSLARSKNDLEKSKWKGKFYEKGGGSRRGGSKGDGSGMMTN